MLESEGETEDGDALDELKNAIVKHQQKHHMQSFNTKNTGEGNNPPAKRKRPNEDVGGRGGGGGGPDEVRGSPDEGRGGPDEDGGAGSVRATDCAELRAEGYEVIPEEEAIVDEFGGRAELLVEVRQPLPTYMPR